jgi:hypothetical protein
VQAHELSAAHAALIATAPGLSRGHSRSASRQDNLSVHLMKKHLFISLATAVMSIMTAGAAAERTPPLTPTAKAATEAAAFAAYSHLRRNGPTQVQDCLLVRRWPQRKR